MDATRIKSEGEEPHHITNVSHSFKYSIEKGTSRTITCKGAQTILEALRTSEFFSNENDAKNVKGEEPVILRNAKSISTNFPCWLIRKDEVLNIKYIKAVGKSEPQKSVVGSPQHSAVVFHVKTEGGKNIKYTGNILNNKNLKAKAEIDEVSVYAFEGETVEEALRRDQRFKSDIFSKCSLKGQDEIVEMSNGVDDLSDKTFKVILEKKTATPKRQSTSPCPSTSSTSTISSPSTGTSPSSSPSPSASSPQQPAINVPEHKARRKINTRPSWAKPCEIPDSKKILDLLRAQFPVLVEHMKARAGESKTEKELLRVEYGKNQERMACMDVKMMKQLTVRAKSVCQVRIEGKAAGTGFLLFDKFILTCAHVIEKVFDDRTKHLTQEVTVSFRFEDLGRSDSDSVPVESQVVAYEKLTSLHSGCYHDWALLELDLELDSNLTGLLSNFVTSASPRGGICIIGHPGGAVKKIDPCFIIPVGDRVKTVDDRHNEVQHLITRLLFDQDELTRIVGQYPSLAYDTCFSYGSSGSPVFDEFCNVVGMHTGGYVYETMEGQPQKVHPQSLMEYAQPLPDILPRIIIQIVERQRFDVLEAYVFYTTSDHPNAIWKKVKDDVNRIVTMQNNTVYKENMANYERQQKRLQN